MRCKPFRAFAAAVLALLVAFTMGAILKNHSGVMEFWQVPSAGHTGAFGREPEEFKRRVVEWFECYAQR